MCIQQQFYRWVMCCKNQSWHGTVDWIQGPFIQFDQDTLSEQLTHSAVDIRLKEISEFLHSSEMNEKIPHSCTQVSTEPPELLHQRLSEPIASESVRPSNLGQGSEWCVFPAHNSNVLQLRRALKQLDWLQDDCQLSSGQNIDVLYACTRIFSAFGK